MNNVLDFSKKKAAHEKISMITCYDYTSAKIIDQTNIDCVLVGDSLAMVMHGCADTTGATLAMMTLHTQAVARGLTNKFIIADMPFMSYRKSLSKSMMAVEKLIQAGAQAVKLEGAGTNLTCIEYIVESGVPVMGHIGLTPQHSHALGGLRVQGKDAAAKNKLLDQAKALEQAGCFAIVLECIPADLAKLITASLQIPTIGIGAGPHTDGQVLVMHDLLGLQASFKPKFLKNYLNGEAVFKESIDRYASEVKACEYPTEEYTY